MGAISTVFRSTGFAALTSLVSVAAAGEPVFTVTTNAETKVVTVRRTNNEEGAFTQSFPDANSVRKLELRYDGSVACSYEPKEASALPDGIEIKNGQWRFASTTAFGTGPIKVGGWSNAGAQVVFTVAGEYDIANDVCLAYVDSKVIASGAAHVTLHSLSVPAGVDVTPWIGRASGETRITLGLDGSENYLKGIRLSGKFSPFDLKGGTIRLSADAQRPFFDYVGADDDKAASVFSVDAEPLTLDAQAGADASMGLPLKLVGVEKEIAVKPANNSFESGNGDWTWAKVDSSAGSQVGSMENGSTWLKTGCNTPDGTHYYVLRCLHKLTSSGTVHLDAAKNWFVSMLNAPRPDGDNKYNSWQIALTVRLTNQATKEVFTGIRPAQSAYYDFKSFEVGPFDLPEGDYTIEFETSWPGSELDANKWSALAIDAVRLVRKQHVANSIVKTGAGRVVMDGVTAEGTAFTVEDGTFALQGGQANDVKVDVKSGATYEFGLGLTRGAEGMTVDVAAGGTFSLRETEGSLIKNGSFESPGTSGFEARAPERWAYSRVRTITGQDAGCGLQKNGSAVTGEGPFTTFGEQTAYLRNGYRLTQAVSVPVAGTYLFSFVRARRNKPEYDWNDFSLKASVSKDDDAHEFTVTLSSEAFESFEQELELSAGTYQVSFETIGANSQNGIMAFVDGVSLSSPTVYPIGDVQDVTVNLKAGSTVRLDNIAEVHIQNVLVNGRRINGGVGHLRSAGVAVEGAGVLRMGTKPGLMLIFR